MLAYIVRHAIAVPHGTQGVAEDERYLTEEGIDKMKKAARGLKILNIRPDLILTSPWTRARQTAEIVREVLGEGIPLENIDALAPPGNRTDVYQAIQQHKNLSSLMLVGHQPSLGEIAGEVAWGSPSHYVELKKGGACCLELADLKPIPRGTLLWLVTPAMLRSAG
jgi:phosphohistidine phosphatase